MRIAQIVLPGASAYELKSQRVDLAALGATHDVQVVALEDVATSGAQVAHVYGPGELPPLAIPMPFVANADVRRSPWPWRRAAAPAHVVRLPEAVEQQYFDFGGRKPVAPHAKVVGTFRRESVLNAIQQSLARIHRFRDDVSWHLFDRVPTPDDLAGVDLWVDPAESEEDFDGFVAEAIVVGVPVVASRTEVNFARLEKGRTGFLVPRKDPNELTHAILSALFKPEVAQHKLQAARQTASKFHARQRLRVLLQMYETLIP